MQYIIRKYKFYVLAVTGAFKKVCSYSLDLLYCCAAGRVPYMENILFLKYRRKEKMSEKCGVALVGYGGMARCWHIKRLTELNDVVRVIGAYDIDEERNRLFTEENIIQYRMI